MLDADRRGRMPRQPTSSGCRPTTSTAPAAYRLCDRPTRPGSTRSYRRPARDLLRRGGARARPLRRARRGPPDDLRAGGGARGRAALDGIEGLSWRDEDGEIHHNPDRLRCSQAEFESLPIPDLTLIRGHEKMGVKPIMTQWGCPFDCEFCSVARSSHASCATGARTRCWRSCGGLDAIEVFFYDDNFVVNKAPDARAAAGDDRRRPHAVLLGAGAGRHGAHCHVRAARSTTSSSS